MGDTPEDSGLLATLSSSRFAAALERAMDKNMERNSRNANERANPEIVRKQMDKYERKPSKVDPAAAARKSRVEVPRFNFWLPRSSDDAPLPSARGDADTPEDTTERSERRQLRYLQIPEEDVKDFRTFAKELTAHLRVECAASNPYVKALHSHRREMGTSEFELRGEDKPESLAMKLATQRHDALASLDVDANLRHGQDLAADATAESWFAVWPPVCVAEAERNGLVCASDGRSQGNIFTRRLSTSEFSLAEVRSHTLGGEIQERPSSEERSQPCDYEPISQPVELLAFNRRPNKPSEYSYA